MPRPPYRKKQKTDRMRLAVRVPLSEDAHALVDRIQPALKLSDLINTPEIRSAVSANQEVGEQVRATLQLPHVEELLRQTREMAAIGNEQLVGPKTAQEMARVAATAASPPLVVSRSTLPPPPTKRSDNTGSSVVVTSARDLGQLIRKERESRKLSQQEFADLVGVGRRFISEFENGKTTLEFDKVLQVVSATGIDVSARRR